MTDIHPDDIERGAIALDPSAWAPPLDNRYQHIRDECRHRAERILTAVLPAHDERRDNERAEHDYCAWCGWSRTRDDSDEDALLLHIMACEKHPLRFGSSKRDELLRAQVLNEAAEWLRWWFASGPNNPAQGVPLIQEYVKWSRAGNGDNDA